MKLHLLLTILLFEVAIIVVNGYGAGSLSSSISSKSSILKSRIHFDNKTAEVSNEDIPLLGTHGTLPDQFYGIFALDLKDNLNDYYLAKGYGWLRRFVATSSSYKMIFTKSSHEHVFHLAILTTLRDVYYRNIILGKTFEAVTTEGHVRNITFSLINGQLFEDHINLEACVDNDDCGLDTFIYYFDEDVMVQKLSYDRVKARRFLVRIPELDLW